ncbi:transcriptional regulator GlxA family with amidase domain [Paraburkholderia silvatlantica]|uniref:AraC family transcriptional regulator n=2 Tax=Paraburkholderia silvatlantica TaxID=321895 RepID=A0A2U1AEE8_9BURK|nr:transcriptional regulator GlxA family with amidase domain [Paraburkholderia silvatlantica]PVY34726.1 AraC family transcriptional regulator [Paraburkholderia silvatlantica]PXW38941.1 AraC family transcriptional regulator [Paraburkholderia silvatlantica]PYE22393.1 AraC family transcriptional regulator [Paraburkholderia silvatlantica]
MVRSNVLPPAAVAAAAPGGQAPLARAGRTAQVAIVALPPVSMSGVGPIVDALSLANEIDGRALYRWQMCSWNGRPVPLAGGAQWPADCAFGDAVSADWLIVVTERYQQFADYRLFLASLARVGQRTPLVTGIHHGIWWLAMAGQLQGYRVAANWETFQQFAEQFERTIVTQHIYEIDRDRATCSGGQATLDFMLAMIGRDHGPELAERIADALGASTLRSGDERQRIPFVTAPGERHPRLNDALKLMEANIEDPLTTDEIANLVGVSRRQLERLFRQYLGAMPSKYYLGLRLAKARSQLQRTSKSVVQISLACGFSSAAHFSNAYRERFGVTPREDRRNWIERQHGGAAAEPRAGALVEPPEVQ